MKGDSITIVVAAGSETHSFTVTATKGGRTVRSKTSGLFTEVEEFTAPSRTNVKGRGTGNKLRARTAAVLVTHETRLEPVQMTLDADA